MEKTYAWRDGDYHLGLEYTADKWRKNRGQPGEKGL